MERTLTTEAIWRALHAQLFGFIRRRVRNDALADDLLQQTFLRIHARIETLRDEAHVNAWVYQIARNVIADYFRARPDSIELDSETPSIESEADDLAAQLAPSIRHFVAALPPTYREAFILTELEGVSQVELARRLGISVSGAKSRVQRARAQVKQMLLDCCHFEFDRLGGVVNYHPRPNCCNQCKC